MEATAFSQIKLPNIIWAFISFSYVSICELPDGKDQNKLYFICHTPSDAKPHFRAIVWEDIILFFE